MLNIALITSRREPHFEWTLASLACQWKPELTPLHIIIVDFHWSDERFRQYIHDATPILEQGAVLTVVPPKPTVWQGPHRLTTRDYWAASNTRNTAICLARGESKSTYLACVDDLSVLMPGWLSSVLAAKREGYVAVGAYVKAKELVVEDGLVRSFLGAPSSFDAITATPSDVFAAARSGFTPGVDTRLLTVPDNDEPYPCVGSWLFGSVAAPLEAFLAINGYDEDSDAMSGEDYLAGLMMQQHGYKFRYCRRMLHLESEEHHHIEPPCLRIIKPYPGFKDASHALLHWVASGARHTAPNYFGEGGIRALRERILDGESFPVMGIPDCDWRDSKPLREM